MVQSNYCRVLVRNSTITSCIIAGHFESSLSDLMKKLLIILFSALLTGHAYAANQVVVIPLFDEVAKLKNIITVAKENGDFTDPVEAVNSIGDASSDNPYLVIIAPGTYTLTQTLAMKNWVSIVGSGRTTTFLTGAISAGAMENSALVSCASNTNFSNMVISNTGDSSYSIGFYCPDRSDVTLEALNVKVTSVASIAYGVYSYFSSLSMSNVNINVVGGSTSYGVYLSDSSLIMNNVTARSSSEGDSYGVYHGDSNGSMNNVTASAGSFFNAYGIYSEHSSQTMFNVTFYASAGGTSYGMYNSNTSPTIRGSSLTGSTAGVHIGSAATRISDTRIEGGISGDSQGGIQCRNTYDENLADVDC